jgi:hypothetical protein
MPSRVSASSIIWSVDCRRTPALGVRASRLGVNADSRLLIQPWLHAAQTSTTTSKPRDDQSAPSRLLKVITGWVRTPNSSASQRPKTCSRVRFPGRSQTGQVHAISSPVSDPAGGSPVVAMFVSVTQA